MPNPSPSSVPTATPSASATPSPSPAATRAAYFLQLLASPSIVSSGQIQTWTLRAQDQQNDTEQVDILIELVGDARLHLLPECPNAVLQCRIRRTLPMEESLEVIPTREGDYRLRLKVDDGTRQQNLQATAQVVDEVLVGAPRQIMQNALAADSATGNRQIDVLTPDGLVRVNDAVLRKNQVLSGSYDWLASHPDGATLLGGESTLLIDAAGISTSIHGASRTGLWANLAPNYPGAIVLATEQGIQVLNAGFQIVVDLPTPDTYALAYADMNQDGLVDIFALNEKGLQPFWQQASGSFATGKMISGDFNTLGIVSEINLLLAQASGGISQWRWDGSQLSQVSQQDCTPLLALLPSENAFWAISQLGVHRFYSLPLGQAPEANLLAINTLDAQLQDQNLILSRGAAGLEIHDLAAKTSQAAQPQISGSGNMGWIMISLLLLGGYRKKLTHISALILLLASGSASALQLDTPTITPVQNIVLSSVEDNADYLISLDGIDVSAYSTLQGDYLIIALPTPPEPGSHQLIVFMRDQDQLLELASWELQIQRQAGATQFRYGLQANLGLNQQLAEKSPGSNAAETTGTGDLQINSEWQRDAWAWSQQQQQLFWDQSQGGGTELVSTRMQLAWNNVQLNAGDLQLSNDARNQIIDSNQRRGLELLWNHPVYRAQLYGARPEPLQGFRHGYGISDNDNRVLGAGLGRNLGDEARLGWQLNALNSASRAQGQTELQKNRLGEALLQGRFGGSQLELRFAASRAEFEQNSVSSGDAWHVDWRHQGADRVIAGDSFFWQSSYRFDRTGSFFYNPLQFATTPDLQRHSANLAAQWGGLSSSAYYQQSRDNVNDLPIGQVRNRLSQVDLNWQPAMLSNDWMQWDMSGSWLQQRLDQVKAHPDPQLAPVDDEVNESSLRLGSQIPWGSLQLQWQQRKQDSAGFASDQQDWQVSLSPLISPLSNGINISPELSWIDRQFDDPSQDNQSLQFNLALNYQSEGALSASLNTRYAEDKSSQSRLKQWQISPQLSWRQALENGLALEIGISGFYDQQKQAGQNNEYWIALLDLRLQFTKE